MTTPFWEDKERLQRLAGIMEEGWDDTHELNAESARQAKVTETIKIEFNKLGLQLAEGRSIMYFEDDDHQAVVILDIPMNEGLSIKKLAGLYSTGLSNDFRVDFAKGQGLQVQFIVSESKRDPI